jgi:predicted NUDIX family NTP pyrophosphohydrolase
MPRPSAGILLYRFNDGEPEVLVLHPGGPFWRNKDLGAWSIPKGEIEPGHESLQTAIRELEEEIGLKVSHDSNFITLKPIRQSGGKLVNCFALNHDFDPATLKSNTFIREWPPGTGQQQEFPEVDRAEWFDLETARQKLIPAQAALIDQLIEKLG